MIRNVLIIEDKKSHREALRKIVSETSQELHIFAVATEKEAYQIAMTHHIHLFIVDIILHPENSGDVSGAEFVREIRDVIKYKYTPLIFITSLEDPKLYSYSQFHCYGYIEKPFEVAQVRKLISETLGFPVVDKNERVVPFKKDGILYVVNAKEIICIESRRRLLTIHCTHEVLEAPYKTVDEILSEIDSRSFIRCSRYTVVNRRYIKAVDYANNYIKLRGMDKTVEIGVIWKKRFMKEMEEKDDE